MGLKFWKKPAISDKTILQITTSEYNLVTLYVDAQTSKKALSLMKDLKEVAKK